MAGAELDAARGVYGISVAAELVGTGVQNLRAYEARGLLEPARTDGGTRRFICVQLPEIVVADHEAVRSDFGTIAEIACMDALFKGI